MSSFGKGRVIAGKYRLDALLAGGGMGSVWKGHDERLDIPVAIKFMLEKLAADPKLRARFEREAKAAAQIRSPNVVHMYDHGIEDGTPYLVMEFLEGEDLNVRLKRTGPFELREVDRICSEICKGLHRAHRHGIIHRDLKPANVFLSAPDDDLVKLLDFGIAKASGIKPVGGETTDTDQILGSPHYLSPEQVRGGELDARSDLWAVAVILYRLLTGVRPIEGTDLGDLCVRICTDPIAPPSQHRPSIDGRVDRFFERAFCRDPDGRHQSAKELAAAFSAVVRQVPITVLDDKPVPASDDAPSWESSRSEVAAKGGPASLPTRQLGAQATSIIEPQPTPIASSRTEAGIRRPAKRWPLWLGAAALVMAGAALALVSGLANESGGGSAATEVSAAASEAAPSAQGDSRATASPSASSAEPAASATVEVAATASATTQPRVQRPPWPGANPKVPPRPRPVESKPPPTGPPKTAAPKPAPPAKPGDIGLGY